MGGKKRPDSLRRDYATYRGYQADRARSLSERGRDIPPIPPVKSQERRDCCKGNFRLFCETYFPELFYLPWSDDHLRVIAKIEAAVLRGELLAIAMPRGSGKTCLCETACLWSILYGYHGFVALIGADIDLARRSLRSMQGELERNEFLAEDFPEATFPIRCLEGIHQRATGQTYRGSRTLIEWTTSTATLPTIEGSPCSGATVWVAGLEGRIVGMKHKRADGTAIRPSLVLVDDPQTPESARSPAQCDQRERVLNGAVLGLAGPGKALAGLMATTVRHPGDLSDRFLDRKRNPQWQGERAKMVYEWPKATALWAKYADEWRAGMDAGEGFARATAFYESHRVEMDEGAVVGWPALVAPGELTAIQHAYNKRLRHGEAAFFAEYQNEPLVEDESAGVVLLSAGEIASKTNGTNRGVAPVGVERVTAFVDVHAAALFWMVVGWGRGFSGWVLNYGVEPEQRVPWSSMRDIRRTLARASPRVGREGAIHAGLTNLADRILSKEWAPGLRIERCLVDAQWGQMRGLVYQFCAESPHRGALTPSHGRYVGAKNRPFLSHSRKPGEIVGYYWRVPRPGRGDAIRHVVFDANHWKSFVHARLSTAKGERGCLTLFGRQPAAHRKLAEHLTAERCVTEEAEGRKADVWILRPDGGDNHWLDCLVGAAVGASMLGVCLDEMQPRRAAVKRRGVRYLRR